MKRIGIILFVLATPFLAVLPAQGGTPERDIPSSARSSAPKRCTPVFELGAGLSLESKHGAMDSQSGLATALSFALDVRLNDRWSVMPSIGHNLMLGDFIHMVRGYVGADFDVFAFHNAAVLGRYHLDDGYILSLGPAVHFTEGHEKYYIDANPDDPRNNLEKIKRVDYTVRARIDKEIGLHWQIGAQFNAGLRNMMIQYPEIPLTGDIHLFSLCLIAGLRF